MSIIDKSKLSEFATQLWTRIKNEISKNQTYLIATNLGLINDGTTDNSATLQALVQDTNIQGRTIFFPKGTYIIGQVGLRSNLHFIGEPGTIFKLKNGSNSILVGNGINNVKFENIDFWGNGTTNRSSTLGTGIGLELSTSTRVTIDKCLFRGFGRTGLYVTNMGAGSGNEYSYNLMINTSRFEQSYYGMEFGVRAEYANVVGCTFGQNYWGAFVGGGNNQFSNCQFNNNQNGLREVGGTIDGVNYPNNSHNSFTGCQYNHNGNNNGIALKLDNCEVGVMFTGCQFFYGTTEFTGNTTGVIFTGCEGGGNWRHISNQTGKVMYTDCYFFTAPNITNPNGNTIYHNNLPNGLFDSSDFVRTNGDNVFTGSNNFASGAPTVNKQVVTHGFEAPSANNAVDSNHYTTFTKSVPANSTIKNIGLPIKNGAPGDKITATIFIVNSTTKEVVEHICVGKKFDIVNYEFNRFKCAIIPVNKTYSFGVSIGIRVIRETVNGKVLSLVYSSTAGNNNTNFSATLPSVGTILNGNSSVAIPHAVINIEALPVLTDGGNFVKLNEENTFTELNNFVDYSPTVTRDFAFLGFEAQSSGIYLGDNSFVANPNTRVPANTQFDGIYLPIMNSQIGDTVEVAYFLTTGNGNRVIGRWDYQTYTVIDEDFLGQKCIKIPMQRTYSIEVSFGFSVKRKTIGNRTIGLCIRNKSGTLISWTGTTLPNDGDVINPTGYIALPYKMYRRMTSKLITRHEERTPGIYNAIGELKTLSYNAGFKTMIGESEWLRCDGQTILSSDFENLFKAIGVKSNDFKLPDRPQVGFLYICIN